MRNIDVFSGREYVCGFNPVCSPFHACVYAHESRLNCVTCACLDSFIIVCDHCVCVCIIMGEFGEQLKGAAVAAL